MLTLPAPTAGPREAHEYLTNILMTKHDTTRAFTEELPSQWGLGWGIHLRNATQKDFIDILVIRPAFISLR